jgi:hypothetical protein
VLVSSTVRDLVNGSGIAFTDRGTHVLKGLPGQWKLFAPAGRDDAIDNLPRTLENPVQDPLADRITSRPWVARMLARMARQR